MCVCHSVDSLSSSSLQGENKPDECVTPPAERCRSTHPTLPFPSEISDHNDLRPRKGEGCRTHVPHSPSKHHKAVALRLFRGSESTAGRKLEDGFNQDRKSLEVNQVLHNQLLREKTENNPGAVPVLCCGGERSVSEITSNVLLCVNVMYTSSKALTDPPPNTNNKSPFYVDHENELMLI